MVTGYTAQVRTDSLAAQVEGLLEQPEVEGVFRDTRECSSSLLLLGLLLLSPPTPRPKPSKR